METIKLYHLYNHANGFENLFLSDENYRYFLQRYDHFISTVADTWVYCLMPNHIHFLVQIKTESEIESVFGKSMGFKDPNFEGFESTNLQGLDQSGLDVGIDLIEKRISQQFSNLFNGYTKAFNKMYDRKGSLFIPNIEMVWQPRAIRKNPSRGIRCKKL
jgi:putative transposase